MLDSDVEHSHPPPLRIPTEVCENVIDMLFSNNTTETFANVATLHTCALVCRDWRVRAQRMLFYQVQLADTTSFRRLSTILDDARHLRDYVYLVELAGHHLHNTASIFALFPVVFTGKLPKLFRIDVVHMPDTAAETPFPRTPGPPKAKALPYIPLHPRFPAFLSAFTTVSSLCLVDTTFRTFSEFARMVHGLPNLSLLACTSVHWIAPGGSHPGADFAEQPEWAAGKDTLPPFAPNIRELWLINVAEYGARRLICTRGPRLLNLTLTVPLSSDPAHTADRGGFDLGSCTGLTALALHLSSEFSMDTHGGFVAKLLGSWKLQYPDSILRFTPEFEYEMTRRRFAEVLQGLGTIVEAWLQTAAEPPRHAGEGRIGARQETKCQLEIQMHEWDAERRWWLDHLERCFPTLSKLGKLKLTILAPQDVYDEWRNKDEPAQSDTSGPSQVEQISSSSISKASSSPLTTQPV